jgi:hypothetical protein
MSVTTAIAAMYAATSQMLTGTSAAAMSGAGPPANTDASW